MVANFLAVLLDIKDYKESNTLGDKNGTLSFNQKVGLLIDIGALTNIDKSKFQTFMEIRNRFMHSMDVNSYSECFSKMKGKEAFLFKTYPQSEGSSNEDKLRMAVDFLIDDVIKLATSINGKILKKIESDVKPVIYENSHTAFIRAIDRTESKFNLAIIELEKKGELKNLNKIKNIGSKFKKYLMDEYHREFALISKTK